MCFLNLKDIKQDVADWVTHTRSYLDVKSQIQLECVRLVLCVCVCLFLGAQVVIK